MDSKYLTRREITDQLHGYGFAMFEFEYDAGAVGTIETDLLVPDDCIIADAIVDVLTDPTSGGAATIALGLNTNTDVVGATAIASFTGILKPSITPFKLTAERKLKITIATAALTAGKFAVALHWYGPFDSIKPVGINS